MGIKDPCMPDATLEDRNYALSCYLTSLALGETINWQHIAYTTVIKYLEAYEMLFDGRTFINADGKETAIPYRYDKDYVSVILTALKNYEGVKDRCNMISDNMMHILYKGIQSRPPHSLPKALFDWIVLGRYTGFRQAEWCQTTQTRFKRIVTWPGKPSLAFTFADFVFLDKNGQRLYGRKALNSQRVHYVIITWRWQKNKDHGQQITYAKDLDNPTFCPVLAAVRIAHRAITLQIHTDHPIAVYKHDDGTCRFITDSEVNTCLRTAAQTAHNIPTGDANLNKWSTHLIRVTACNLLHRQKFSDSYIQNRLRWKSKCWKDYLCNTFYTADQHTILLSDTNLPRFSNVLTQRPNEPHEDIMVAA